MDCLWTNHGPNTITIGIGAKRARHPTNQI
jgi:hypothetical protein